MVDRQLAAELAHLAALAYEDLETVKWALPNAEVGLIDIDDTQAYKILFTDHAVVSCRGTQVTANWSWPDITTNFLQGWQEWPIAGEGAEIHAGYGEAVEDIFHSVKGFAATFRAPGFPVYFGGHSLGGDLATLLHSGIENDGTITFGAPRVGNRAFANAINDGLVRICYGYDIAPSYPHWKLGYRHGGERYQLSRRGGLRAGGAWRDLTHTPLVVGVLDHRVAHYEGRL